MPARLYEESEVCGCHGTWGEPHTRKWGGEAVRGDMDHVLFDGRKEAATKASRACVKVIFENTYWINTMHKPTLGCTLVISALGSLSL